MTRKDPARLGDLLGAGRLGRLTKEAERRRALADRVRALLPSEEAEHVVSASMTAEGQLVLVMDSAAWAARVRYRAERLGVTELRVKVSPQTR
jgi:hypothetical protein